MVTKRVVLTALGLLASLGLGVPPAGAQETASPAAPAVPSMVSSSAERVYGAARNKLLQIRTLLGANGHQTTLGSAFLVGRDLAITNYHVVSQYVLEPELYRLEY